MTGRLGCLGAVTETGTAAARSVIVPSTDALRFPWAHGIGLLGVSIYQHAPTIAVLFGFEQWYGRLLTEYLHWIFKAGPVPDSSPVIHYLSATSFTLRWQCHRGPEMNRMSRKNNHPLRLQMIGHVFTGNLRRWRPNVDHSIIESQRSGNPTSI